MSGWITPAGGGVRLSIQVQPRASRNECTGIHADALRVRLTAPPVDGAANTALVRFLAQHLGVPRSAVEIVQGHAGRRKVIEIRGVTPETVRTRLAL